METKQKSKYIPCPFCGCTDIFVVRHGTQHQSCIMRCTECGCLLESNEIGAGEVWNNRAQCSICDRCQRGCDCKIVCIEFIPMGD